MASTANAQRPFHECVEDLGQIASARGISAATVESVLPSVKPLERVIQADRNQPEFVQTFGRYFRRRINDRRITTGRRLYSEHRALLDDLAVKTGVPGQYLVAFWALESNFGGFIGDVPVFDSLSTLACDSRRSEMFTTEFVNALRIVDQGTDPTRMIGSWAGAMGQTQFMPSTYLAHATDGNGDGSIDIWGTAEDALASAANFVGGLGWETGVKWGREVLLPEGFDYAASGREQERELSEWRAMGVLTAAGRPVPDLPMLASMIVPSGSEGPAFLVYDNFNVIMRWNRSVYFALTVGHLADRIAGGGALARSPESGDGLSRSDLLAVQQQLHEAGYDPGPVDGVLGSGTRAALRAYQSAHDLVADGYPSATVLAALGVQ